MRKKKKRGDTEPKGSVLLESVFSLVFHFVWCVVRVVRVCCACVLCVLCVCVVCVFVLYSVFCFRQLVFCSETACSESFVFFIFFYLPFDESK